MTRFIAASLDVQSLRHVGLAEESDRNVKVDSGVDESCVHRVRFLEHDAGAQASQVECLKPGMDDDMLSYLYYVGISLVLMTLFGGTLLLSRRRRARLHEVVLSSEPCRERAHRAERCLPTSQPCKGVGEEKHESNPRILSALCAMCYEEEPCEIEETEKMRNLWLRKCDRCGATTIRLEPRVGGGCERNVSEEKQDRRLGRALC